MQGSNPRTAPPQYIVTADIGQILRIGEDGNPIPAEVMRREPLDWPLPDRLQILDLSSNMQVSSPASAPPQCNVDPAGDMTLLVGEEENQVRIRVSSTVLGLASPIFATMFGPRYLEGHVLSNQTDLSIPSISLPDDDPEAMTWFCQALHLQVDGNETEVPPGLRVRIATLCDKYDASKAISGWSQFWLRDLLDPMVRDPTVPSSHAAKVLYMAYAFKDHRAFWLATRDILYHSSEWQIHGLKDSWKDSILPGELVGSIEIEYHTIHHAFQRAVEQIISPYTRHLCMPYSADLRQMCGGVVVIGQYFQELENQCLWPLKLVQSPRAGSFYEMKERISEFQIYPIRNTNNSCGLPNIDFEKSLQIAYDDILRNQKGLCLKCVDEGKIMVSDGNCGAESYDSCSGDD